MASDTSELIIFDDFSGGDYGRDWAGTDTHNKFRAVNVLLYPGGWIGPRAPMVAMEGPGGLTGVSIWFFDNNHLLTSDGYGWNFLTGEKSVDPLDDVTKLKDYFLDQFGDLACCSSDVATQDDVVFTVNFPTKTDTVPVFVSTLGTGPSGLRAQRHEDVSVIFGNRKFIWSESEEWQVWPVDNFATVNVLAVYDAILQKNTLVCLVGSFPTTIADNLPPWGDRGGSVNGADVYVIYGTLGANATLRKVASGPAPVHTDSGAYLFTPGGDTVYWFSNRWLVSFDGSIVRTAPAPLPRLVHDLTDVPDLSPDTFLQFWSSAPNKAQGEFVLAGSLTGTDNRRAVLNWFHGDDSGAWTSHDPGIPFTTVTDTYPGADQAHRGAADVFIYNDRDQRIVLATQGSNTEDPKFYEMDLDPSFPDYTDNDGDTSNPVVCDFHTADYWDPQNREMSVEGVWVDYAFKPATLADYPDRHPNQFTIEVESVQTYNDQAPRSGGSVTFDADAEGRTMTSSDQGTGIVRGRKYIPVRSYGSGGGFRLHLSDWSGVSIRRLSANVRLVHPR